MIVLIVITGCTKGDMASSPEELEPPATTSLEEAEVDEVEAKKYLKKLSDDFSAISRKYLYYSDLLRVPLRIRLFWR